jgi:hypothetical protein
MYNSVPGDEFWASFPKNKGELKVESAVSVSSLKHHVASCSKYLSMPEKMRTNRAIMSLVKGAPAAQKGPLPPCSVKHTHSTYKHGFVMTDTIAEWVKQGYVAGPYDTPPFTNFRANSLLAVEQPTKIRPVLDISQPKGQSFNDNINKHFVEKTEMATAHKFAYAVRDAGLGAIMSKFDAKDAYKLIPAQVKDFPAQGFAWLGKYFIEKKQIFGASTAVANYDIFSNTIRSIALCYSSIPRCLVFRCLDDVPIVSPKSSSWCQEFSKVYSELCKDLNVTLAKECPNADKAFLNKTSGKVLGIRFNTENLSWTYTEEKISKCLGKVNEAIAKRYLSVKEMQKLLGSLNDFGLLCPFIKTFKYALNECLRVAIANGSCVISDTAVAELRIWAACMIDNRHGFPIPARPCEPPVYCNVFVSDAAGVPNFKEFTGNEGVGGIGFNYEGIIINAYQFFWPKKFIQFHDAKGACMGAKTTSLEILGILLHLVYFPELFINCHVIFKTDNIACYYGWENKTLRNDCTASIVLRSIMLISAKLCCNIHFKHLPRLSTWEGVVADRLSRRSSTSSWDHKLVQSFGRVKMPESLKAWLDNPSEDWSLPSRIVEEI